MEKSLKKKKQKQRTEKMFTVLNHEATSATSVAILNNVLLPGFFRCFVVSGRAEHFSMPLSTHYVP